MPLQEKITFGEMRASGASRIIVHCGDYKCGHSVTMYPALWPDNVRLSDLEERFVCTVCGHRGADVRPLFEPARMGTGLPIAVAVLILGSRPEIPPLSVWEFRPERGLRATFDPFDGIGEGLLKAAGRVAPQGT